MQCMVQLADNRSIYSYASTKKEKKRIRMTRPRVKICCISSIEEARIAIEHGASALGLVGHMPSGLGVIEDQLINQIAKSIPPTIATFLQTSEIKSHDIISHYQKVNTTTIQFVDELEDRDYTALRNELPNVKLVRVIHVIDSNSIKQAVELSKFVDAILFDSGNPKLVVKELGGTGRTHNWNLSREIRASIDVPVFLAGGLSEDNVKQAIETVEPFGLDLCSSVRTNGNLDKRKLKDFFNAVENVK